MPIPKDAVGPVTLEAKLNYRKFANYYTKFAFAGVAKPGSAGLDYDSREYTFDPAPVPDLPIVTLAHATSHDRSWASRTGSPSIRKQDRERWNDWGIGLLLQGDLKGAEYAFRRVTEAEPAYADGWLNVARALIQEGETEAARPFVEKALALQPHTGARPILPGDDPESRRRLRWRACAACTRPRGSIRATAWSLNQIGRILFLQRRYADAVAALQKTLAVDPEDVQAHYNLMLCYRGLGQTDKAEREAETVPAIQGGRVVAGADREAAAVEPRGQQ